MERQQRIERTRTKNDDETKNIDQFFNVLRTTRYYTTALASSSEFLRDGERACVTFSFGGSSVSLSASVDMFDVRCSMFDVRC